MFATPILGSDTLYALLVTAAAAAIFVPRVRSALLGGALLGASQYVRATTIRVLPAFLAVLRLLPAWRARVLAVLLAAGIVLLPVFVHNRIAHDEWSIATSRFGGWSLLVGSNQSHDGMYNTDDLALIGGPSAFGSDAADRLAQTLAIQRITRDPGGFAGLVVRKFNVLWGSGYWGIPPPRPPLAGHPCAGVAWDCSRRSSTPRSSSWLP